MPASPSGTAGRTGGCDACFFHEEMDGERPHCPPGLRMYPWMMQKDRWQRLLNQVRLCALAADEAPRVEVCCAHDPPEFERLLLRRLGEPVAPAAGWRATPPQA